MIAGSSTGAARSSRARSCPPTCGAPRGGGASGPCPRVERVRPLLYLHGLSTGDFREALPALLGADAAGLSPSTITRLTTAWAAEYTAFRRRGLGDRGHRHPRAAGGP